MKFHPLLQAEWNFFRRDIFVNFQILQYLLNTIILYYQQRNVSAPDIYKCSQKESLLDIFITYGIKFSKSDILP